MRNLSPSQLQEKDYKLLCELQHDDLIHFIKEAYRKKTPFSVGFNFLVMIILGSVAAIIGYQAVQYGNFWQAFTKTLLGIAVVFPLIPIHELIHGWVYKLLGAPHVGYTANFKKMYFTAQANLFIVNYKEFLWVAFAPFVVISMSCLGSLFFLVDTIYLFVPLGTLLFHTVCCSGDFALASYVYPYRKQGIVTYDDFPNKRTYFFVQNEKQEA